MLSAKFLDELAGRIGDVIRASPAKDLERNVRTLLGSVFTRLDLVTRDEFEVQAQLLLRTREKLERLEQQIAALSPERPRETGKGRAARSASTDDA